MRSLFVAVTVFGLAACAGSTSAVTDSVRLLIAAPAADTAKLNPQLRYLRVTAGKNVALLVLGYTEDTPAPGTQVWYSADKETIRVWNGRLAGTAGLHTDWRSVRFADVPTWRTALAGGASYQRQRDVMPGYQVDTRDTVWIVPIATPSSSLLRDIPPQSLQWFEERTVRQGQAASLPAARFAVDLSGGQERVVYSEQCLSAAVCLTLQPWPAVAPSPTAASSS